jgi:hypothetical protein
MKKTVGPVSTCGRELLRGWWRPIGLMVSPEYFGCTIVYSNTVVLKDAEFIPPESEKFYFLCHSWLAQSHITNCYTAIPTHKLTQLAINVFNSRVVKLILQWRSLLDCYGIRLPGELFTYHLQVAARQNQISDVSSVTWLTWKLVLYGM